MQATTEPQNLNPLQQSEPLSFHQQLTLWNAYEGAVARAKHALMLCAIFAVVLLLFSVMTALDDAHQRAALANAEARVLAANIRALGLIDYLNKIK